MRTLFHLRRKTILQSFTAANSPNLSTKMRFKHKTGRNLEHVTFSADSMLDLNLCPQGIHCTSLDFPLDSKALRTDWASFPIANGFIMTS